MKKKNSDEMLPEYDFTDAKRGKYAKLFDEGSNIVVLAPDLLKIFPDSDAVNDALRAIAKIAVRSKKQKAE